MASFLERILSHGPKTKVLTQEQAARSVVVSNIAPQTADENIVIHFQKSKNGGGEIDHVHIPKKGTAVITFERSEVAKRVLEYSHILEESTLELHLCVPKEPPEVFKQVKARVNFETFHLSTQQSRDMLEVLKENTKVVEVDSKNSKDCKIFVVAGTFSQIEASHKLLQCLIHQKVNGKQGVIDYVKSAAETQQDGSNKLTSDTYTAAESNSFEVQPQFMKLLKRVYKKKLQEIEENFCVHIIWDENTTQVCISPSKTSNSQNPRFQEGCDAFIDLYQEFHPNMGREEVELPNGTDEVRITEAVSLAESQDPMVIERVGKNLVVYADKNSIKSSAQSLKEKLGLTYDGNSRKTRRGLGNKRRNIREENETLHQDLRNGVKLSLYQGDITDEPVDAIVNAANEWLQHGAGVAAAIVRKGGRQIQDESNWVTKRNGPLNVGGVVHTSGGDLPCRYVIHTVGPRWKEHGREKSISLLRRACVESLLHAAQLELSSIALTAISSGIFGMPKDICAEVMFKAVEEFSSSNDVEFSTLRDVRIVIIDDATISVFQEEFIKRYFPQEASLDKVTTETRPSDELRATAPPTPDSKLDEGKSKGHDPFVSVNETQIPYTTLPDGQQGQNDSGNLPRKSSIPDKENSGQRDVPDGLSNQNTEKKESLPTSAESPKMEENEESHELNQNNAASVVNQVKGEENGDFKGLLNQGRGKGKRHIAAKFQSSPAEKGDSEKSNESTNLDGVIADSGTGKGMLCNTTSPPGLAVSEEGKHLAKTLGDRGTVDPKSNADGSVTDRKDVKKNDSSSDSLKDANNLSNDGENPDVDSFSGNPTDHSPSGTNLTPGEKMPEQDTDQTNTRESERPLSDGSRKRSPVEYTGNDKPGHAEPKKERTNTDKKVTKESEPVAETTHDETEGPPPLFDMPVGNRKNEPNCLMCMNFNKDPLSPSKCGRGHYYCKSCIKRFLEKTGLCPQCDKEGSFQFNQPTGYMSCKTVQISLPGYEGCDVIVMSFTFQSGTQGPEHPNPGQPYSALYTSAFLPCNSDGKEVCSLLEKAFKARLLFTIGTSLTTREENKIIWNGIELKTNQFGGPASYGYPDPSYLDRVKKQLAEKGITQPQG